jgi:hypothetical protein
MEKRAECEEVDGSSHFSWTGTAGRGGEQEQSRAARQHLPLASSGFSGISQLIIISYHISRRPADFPIYLSLADHVPGADKNSFTILGCSACL